MTKTTRDPSDVWRIVFTPKQGIRVTQLSSEEKAEVSEGEDRVGFLPRDFFRVVLLEGVALYRPPLPLFLKLFLS